MTQRLEVTNDQQTARCRDQMGQVQGVQDHRSVSILDIEFRSSALARRAPIKRPTLDGKTAPRNTWLAPSRPEPPISHPSMLIGDEPEQHRRPSRLVRRCHRRMRESEPSHPNVSRQSFPEGSVPSIRTHPSWDFFGVGGIQFDRPDHNHGRFLSGLRRTTPRSNDGHCRRPGPPGRLS